MDQSSRHPGAEFSRGAGSAAETIPMYGDTIRMRLRFSLRTLFILTTLTAIACAWAVLPSLTAKRFH